MTPEQIHDALNLLPSDLITAADRVRTKQTPKVIRWQRWVSLAAVLTLVVGTTLVFRKNIGFDSLKGAGVMPESVMQQAPAAAAPMAPAPVEDEVAAEEAMPEPPSDIGAPEVPYEEAGDTKAENSLSVDHSHRFAEPGDPGEDEPSGYCGNLTVTVTIAGESHSLTGADSLAMTEILRDLPYDPSQVCRCMAEFTVDTELLSGIHVNLTQGFARCEKGQAALTEEQARILQDIIDSLQ
mgnify:CR=1 FL=1